MSASESDPLTYRSVSTYPTSGRTLWGTPRALYNGRHAPGLVDPPIVVARIFADRCIAGLEWDVDALAAHLEGSYAEAVELAAREGYEASARRYGKRDEA